MLEEILRQGFAELGLPLDETALRRCRVYYDNLIAWNRVMNLTAITAETSRPSRRRMRRRACIFSTARRSCGRSRPPGRR